MTLALDYLSLNEVRSPSAVNEIPGGAISEFTTDHWIGIQLHYIPLIPRQG